MKEKQEQFSIVTSSPEETENVGRLIGAGAAAGLFVGLRGDLGSGKTAFVRGIARGLGIQDHVTSPTFQLVREYSGREKLFHFDFYRLVSAGDIVDLDIGENLETGIVAAEWSDKFSEICGSDFLLLSLQWTGDTSRAITFEDAGGSGIKLLALLRNELLP